MYIENLYTPHPERAKGTPPTYLEDTLGLQPMAETLANLKHNPEQYEATALQYAEHITQTVHKTLSYQSNEADTRLLTPEHLADGQTSNCYGYTVVLSECFERAGIRHFVAFANSHAMTVVVPLTDSEPWTFDSLTPQFDSPLDGAVSKSAFTQAITDIEKYGRGAVKFYSRVFARQSKFNMPFHELVERNKWLSVTRISQTTERNYDEAESGMRNGQILFMSLFEPQTGREALVAHKAMNHALNRGKRADAYRAFKQLKRYYPELDARNAPQEITDLVHELGAAGCVGMAKRVVDESMESFAISHDPRFKLWQADLYRRLGSKKAQPQLLRDAIVIYKQTIPNAKYPNLAKAKLHKAEKQLAKLLLQTEANT